MIPHLLLNSPLPQMLDQEPPLIAPTEDQICHPHCQTHNHLPVLVDQPPTAPPEDPICLQHLPINNHPPLAVETHHLEGREDLEGLECLGHLIMETEMWQESPVTREIFKPTYPLGLMLEFL